MHIITHSSFFISDFPLSVIPTPAFYPFLSLPLSPPMFPSSWEDVSKALLLGAAVTSLLSCEVTGLGSCKVSGSTASAEWMDWGKRKGAAVLQLRLSGCEFHLGFFLLFLLCEGLIFVEALKVPIYYCTLTGTQKNIHAKSMCDWKFMHEETGKHPNLHYITTYFSDCVQRAVTWIILQYKEFLCRCVLLQICCLFA